jgi:hypothetical protein
VKKYNSPPNWPTPPQGWKPPAGWQPDPQWGPAPVGHQFWVSEPIEHAGTPAYGSAADAGKGLSITALSIACVALVLCWIPIVNNLVFFLGLAALGFAVPALVVTIRSRSGARGMAIAASVVSVLSIVGVLATQAFYMSLFQGGTPSARSNRIDTPATSATESPGAAGSTPSASTVAAVRLGRSATVGSEYQVTVSAVDLNANETVLAANSFNDKPKGQFILVSLSVKYQGDKEGNPWIDLSETFVGTDARQYDASDCGAVAPNPVADVPTLERGGVASFQVCIDVPPAAVKGGRLFVEPSLSFNDNHRVYWSIK